MTEGTKVEKIRQMEGLQRRDRDKKKKRDEQGKRERPVK